MIPKPLLWTLVALALAGEAVTIAGTWHDNQQLEARLAVAQRRAEQVATLRESNRHTRELVARAEADTTAATASTTRAEVLARRAEVATLEQKAAADRTRLTDAARARALALETGRDPVKGLTRLEYVQNRGRATPADAIQTLAWAALKGDNAKLGEGATFSPAARTKAEALIASLPAETRAQWTPEKLAAMFYTGAFGDVAAMQIVGETARDPQHSTLKVFITRGEQENTMAFQFQQGAEGWQIVADEKVVATLQRKMTEAKPRATSRQDGAP